MNTRKSCRGVDRNRLGMLYMSNKRVFLTYKMKNKMAVKPKKQQELSYPCLDDTMARLKDAVKSGSIANEELPDGEGQLKDYAAYLLTGNEEYFPQEWPNNLRDFNEWTYRGRLVKAGVAFLLAGFRLDEQDNEIAQPVQNPKFGYEHLPEKFHFGELGKKSSLYSVGGCKYYRDNEDYTTFWREDIYEKKTAKKASSSAESEFMEYMEMAKKQWAKPLGESPVEMKSSENEKKTSESKHGYWEGGMFHLYGAVKDESPNPFYDPKPYIVQNSNSTYTVPPDMESKQEG